MHMHTIDLPPYYRFGWSWWCWWCVSMLVKLRRAEPRLVWGGEGREEEEEAEEGLVEELELMMQVLETGSLVGERELGAEADHVLESVTSGYQANSIFFWIAKNIFPGNWEVRNLWKCPREPSHVLVCATERNLKHWRRNLHNNHNHLLIQS